MQITDQYRYNRCIAIAAKLDQIVHMIDDMESVDEELLNDDEYNKYIVHTSGAICELSDIMRNKSKWYVHKDDPDILDR